jgi:hypothetical protein
MSGQATIADLYERFKGSVAFLTIYIEEAHPLDEWFLPEAVGDNTKRIIAEQHKSIASRIDAAKTYIEESNNPMEVVCDSLRNDGVIKFDAWPDRIYIIEDGVIVYQGAPGPFGFYLDEVTQWLMSRTEGK